VRFQCGAWGKPQKRLLPLTWSDMRSPLTLTRPSMRSPLGRTLTRYVLGSIIAMAVSEATLLSVFGLHLQGARVAAAAAWATGAIANYFLNRNWAWQRRGRAHPVKELLPYWIIAVAGLLLSVWATHAASAFAPRLSGSHTLATVFAGAAYLGTYGFLFVAKFFLFHYVIFNDRRSRDTEVPGAQP
jgi:putative flippase GtrA